MLAQEIEIIELDEVLAEDAVHTETNVKKKSARQLKKLEKKEAELAYQKMVREENDKKRTVPSNRLADSYTMPKIAGQRFETPPHDDGTRIFYESLLQ